MAFPNAMRLLATLLAAMLAVPAAAQSIVTSSAPDSVAVTVYRDPHRGGDGEMNLQWLGGYALVTETRRIRLSAGESVIRFEGVAGGIIPQSAIVTGFPGGIVERNRDAYLLSPATLIDRSLGRRVHIRRTDRATGAVSEAEAVLMSGADGAVVLQTRDGFEALRCTGLNESTILSGVPQELSAQPTLSVRTRAAAPVEATVTLSYLATGFDWQANYIAHLSDDGRTMELFAWLTLANGDETGFRDAQTQAVAGQPNWERVQAQPRQGGPLALRCWPQGRTHQIPLTEFERLRAPVDDGFALSGGSDIIVTAQRTAERLQDAPIAVTVLNQAQLEAIGDLKLYRIPEPVTVAARSQKQVALLARDRVQVEIVHRFQARAGGDANQSLTGARYLVTRNREDRGLGLPLPSGGFALFANGPDRPILIGEGGVEDSAVGGDVEIAIGSSPGVRASTADLSARGSDRRRRMTITNDSPSPVQAEVEFPQGQRVSANRRLTERRGTRIWRVSVPANGEATLDYRIITSG